jgi:hypothetical protein
METIAETGRAPRAGNTEIEYCAWARKVKRDGTIDAPCGTKGLLP